MNEQLVAVTALLGSFVGLGGLGLAAWKFARPAAEVRLTDQAAFQDRLIKSNESLSIEVDRFRAEVADCEDKRRRLEQKQEHDRAKCESEIARLWAEIGRLKSGQSWGGK